MLKVEFHSHTNHIQPNETNHSPKELIDHAVKLGYDILCITEHYWPKCPDKDYAKDPLKTYYDFKDYAKDKGLLLVPGVEYYFDEGEVLLINFKGDVRELKTLLDIKNLENVLKVPSHPYYWTSLCLGDEVEKNIELFDGIEHSHFYLKHFNLNKKAIAIAQAYGLPLVGSSDLHDLRGMGYNYSLVDCKKNANSLVKAVKAGKISLVTRPFPLHRYLYSTYFHTFRNPSKFYRNLVREIKLRI